MRFKILLIFSLILLPSLSHAYPWQEYEYEISVNLMKSFSPEFGGVDTIGGRYKHHKWEASAQLIDEQIAVHGAYRTPFGESKFVKPHAAGGMGYFDGVSFFGGVGVNFHTKNLSFRVDQYLYIKALIFKMVPLTTIGVSWSFHEWPF